MGLQICVPNSLFNTPSLLRVGTVQGGNTFLKDTTRHQNGVFATFVSQPLTRLGRLKGKGEIQISEWEPK